MQGTSSHSARRGYFLALLSAFVLSLTGVLIKILTTDFQLPALVLAFWRDVFVISLLLLVLLIKAPKLIRIQKHNLVYFLIYGFSLSIFNSLWTTSIFLNGAAVGTLLVYCSTAFTVVLGFIFLREKITAIKVVAVILSLLGCALVANAHDPTAWQTNMLGILIGLLSGVLYAVYSLLGRAAAVRGLNPWTTLLYSFGFAAVFLLLYNLSPIKVFPGTAKTAGQILWLGRQWAGWAYLISLAIPTLLGFGLFNMSLVDLPSSIANLVLSIEPVFTAIIAYFWLAEQWSLIQIFGSILVLLSIYILAKYEKTSPERV